MSTLTKNLKLTKPDATENYSVDTYNANWDRVDEAIQRRFESLYPVGSVYTNANNPANPHDLLGFGTWEAFGQGRMLTVATKTDHGRHSVNN